ncbi:MAG: NPCBM/NEW2 domain-containing protein [Kiritimatiellaeota bacterium]|nr:NPCBM/NEW2 domain-containing protein [Kiritimatiellota bacterium]
MKRFSLLPPVITLLLTLGCGVGRAAEATTNSMPGLDELRKQFETTIRDVQRQGQESTKLIQQRDLAGLSVLEEALQSAGNQLPTVLAVNAEKTRFEQSSDILDNALSTDLPAVRKLQDAWRAQTASAPTASAKTVWLDDLNLGVATQGWGAPQKNKSVGGQPLSLGGRKFERGFGTHAESRLQVNLKGGALRFSATVGVDNEINDKTASVEFFVYGDGKLLWESGVLRAGQAAKACDVNLADIKTLLLEVGEAGDGKAQDHADWAEAKFETAVDAVLATSRAPPPGLLTPPVPATPRINGARVFGVRPGKPCLYTIAASGERPMRFAAKGLPRGLALDRQTGRITGSVAKAGTYPIDLTATNGKGAARRELKLVVGDTICLTPPMGWNSWNCYARDINTERIRATAKAMAASGLINHGWQYINIDDFWQVHHESKDPTMQGPRRAPDGRIVPNPRFPDMQGLIAEIHDLGLKFGIYSSPGPRTCGGCEGSCGHEELDAQQYAEWGVDYLKYDMCSYSAPSGATNGYKLPFMVMGELLRKQNRDIVFSVCNFGNDKPWEWAASVGGNCWRTTGDIDDKWETVARCGFERAGPAQAAGPGHWNDPDMLVVGRVGWGANHWPSNLKPDEQYTHISLWCLLASPLLLGCDLTELDEFTLSLLTNDEVIEVNQDPLGRQAGRVAKEGDLEVWAKDMEDGSKAVGLFNRGRRPAEVTARWKDLGITGPQKVRDLWRQQNLTVAKDEYRAEVPGHGCLLLRIGGKQTS